LSPPCKSLPASTTATRKSAASKLSLCGVCLRVYLFCLPPFLPTPNSLFFFNEKKKKRQIGCFLSSQVLRSPRSPSHQLPQKEVWTHHPIAHQEKVEVSVLLKLLLLVFNNQWQHSFCFFSFNTKKTLFHKIANAKKLTHT